MKKSRKAQIEMIGLLVIVILFIFIGIFAIRFALRPESTIVAEMRTNIMVNNMLNAIIKTNTQFNKDISELIVDCYNTDANACTFVKQEIPKIIELSLGKQQNYEFSVFANKEEFEELSIKKGSCKYGNTADYTKRAENVNFEIKLKLC